MTVDAQYIGREFRLIAGKIRIPRPGKVPNQVVFERPSDEAGRYLDVEPADWTRCHFTAEDEGVDVASLLRAGSIAELPPEPAPVVEVPTRRGGRVTEVDADVREAGR